MASLEEELGNFRSKASKIYIEKCGKSAIFKNEEETSQNAIPEFSPTEIVDKIYLGSGGFCTITEIQNVILSDNSEAAENPQSFAGRSYIAENFEDNGKGQYAIKRISVDLSAEPVWKFIAGVVDLAMEVKYLSVLSHPNIIKMRGVSSSHPCSEGFFFVMDKMYDTLEDRMKGWKKMNRRMSGLGRRFSGLGRRFSGGGRRFSATGGGRRLSASNHTAVGMEEPKGPNMAGDLGRRLKMAMDLCSALSYLHKKKIVYRDLKPENIGFDAFDDIKLFDFGSAGEICEADQVEGTDTYRMTAGLGAPRYMSPEVALGLPYNHKADVYSFAILLWELCELKTPFLELDVDSLATCVYSGDERPKVSTKKWSQRFNDAIVKSWSPKIDERLECADLIKVLLHEIGLTCKDGRSAAAMTDDTSSPTD